MIGRWVVEFYYWLLSNPLSNPALRQHLSFDTGSLKRVFLRFLEWNSEIFRWVAKLHTHCGRTFKPGNLINQEKLFWRTLYVKFHCQTTKQKTFSVSRSLCVLQNLPTSSVCKSRPLLLRSDPVWSYRWNCFLNRQSFDTKCPQDRIMQNSLLPLSFAERDGGFILVWWVEFTP